MKGINGNGSLNINLSKLGLFGSVKTEQGDHGRATLRLSGNSTFEAGKVYSSTNLIDRWFRSAADKKANNDVRTKLIENLAGAFGFGGVQRNAQTGEVTFSKELMDSLEQILGKDVLSRSDFGIGKDGKVGSGSPLTERRITTIVNRVHDLCLSEAKSRLSDATAVLQNQMTLSRLEFNNNNVLTPTETAKIVKAFKEAGGTMASVDTVGKLKQLVERATGLECHVVCSNPQEAEALLGAQLANPRLFESVFVAVGAQGDPLQEAAKTLLETLAAPRRSLRTITDCKPIPSQNDLAEAFDFNKADLFVSETNVHEVRKNPCGRGSVVAYYPDDVKEMADTLREKYEAAPDGVRGKTYFALFFGRQYVFEIEGEELSSRNTTEAEFLRKIEAFFGDDAKMGNAFDTVFGGFISLPPQHVNQAKTGLSAYLTVSGCTQVQQKLTLSKNADGSFRVTNQLCCKGFKEFNMWKCAPSPVPEGAPKEDTLVPIRMVRAEGAPETDNSYYAYKLVFDVRKTESGLEVKGVGDHPAAMKYNFDNGYVDDDKYNEGLSKILNFY